jgi:hypothetical protein
MLAVLLFITGFLANVPAAQATTSSCATSWSNFTGADGFITEYTYQGASIRDYETSQDPTNGGAAVSPTESDLASGSPGSFPGPESTTFFGYYDGGTNWDPNDPSTLEDDYILFRWRLAGDPAQQSGFKSGHWNVLFDLDRDGYKDYWVDVDGNDDVVQILYDNANRQDIPDPDAAEVEEFTARNSANNNCGGTSPGTSHTRSYAINDGTGDYYLDVQVPVTAFNDLNGNQILFPDSPVSYVYTTSASNTDPLQKDHMMDLKLISLTDPIQFGDVVTPSGQPSIFFTNSAQAPVEYYTVGDRIYLYVTDPTANTNNTVPDCIEVIVANPATGDNERVRLCETGPRTGMFTNEGGACAARLTAPSPTPNPPTAWIPGIVTSDATVTETWTIAFSSGTTWTVTGSVSGAQPNATAGTAYTSTTGGISFTLYQSSPAAGTRLTFCTEGADVLLSSSNAGAATNDNGTLQVASGQTIYVSYTNATAQTVTDSAVILGPCEPFIQFTRSTGLPSTSFQLNPNSTLSDKLYVTVTFPNANTNATTVQTISVTLTGNDTQTLTLTETGVNTGVFRNTTGLSTKVSDGTVTANDNLWEDNDGGTVTATYNYTCNGVSSSKSTTATVFNTASGGIVQFTNGAGTQDVSLYSGGQPVFLKVTDATACPTGGTLTVIVTTAAGDSETVTVYETASGSGVYMNRRNDLVTTAGSAVVTSASSTFVTDGLVAGGRFAIATGPDMGLYTIASIQSETQLTLTTTLTSTRTGVAFNARPLITATYDGSVTANDRVLETRHGETYTVSYTDCNDGDSNSGNNVKTDTAEYNAPDLVINRVLFYPDAGTCQTEFVEIYNGAASAITATAYRLRDEDSQLDYTVPTFNGSPLVLQPGERIILSIGGSDTNFFQSGTYYLFAPSYPTATYPSRALGDPGESDPGDQLTLYDSGGAARDYVAWSNRTTGNTTDFLADDANAVLGEIWPDDGFRYVGGMGLGQVMRRSTSGFDTNVPADWSLAAADTTVCTAVAAANRATIRGLRVDPGGVVEFATGTQINTAAFTLYGVDEPLGRGPRVLLSPPVKAVVPSSVSPIFYRVDTAPIGTPYILIEELETNGERRELGPYEVGDEGLAEAFARLEERLADFEVQATDHARVPGARRAHARIAATPVSRSRRPGEWAVRVEVSSPGVVELRVADLVAFGMPAGVAHRPEHIRVWHHGSPVAVSPRPGDGRAGGRIAFLAPAFATDYTTQGVYVVTWPGSYAPPAPQVAFTRSGVPLAPGMHRVAPETMYAPFVPRGADPWIWGFLISGWPGLPFNFDLPGYAAGTGNVPVRVGLVGVSEHTHIVEAFVNGVSVGRATFQGRTLGRIDGTMWASSLRAAGNQLSFNYTTPSGKPFEGFALLDSVDLGVTLPAPLAPATFTLDGYEPRLPSLTGVDYLVLTHPAFLDHAQRIASLKASEGYRPLVLDTARAYDRYSAGVFEAAAIRALIAEVARHTKLRFVLLVGDDTFDYKNNLGTGAVSYVPSLSGWDGLWGAVPSENRYADIDGDGRPDVAIGRLPVQTPEQAEVLVAKIAQQSSLLQAAAGRQTLAVDNHKGKDLDFFQQAMGVAPLLPRGSSIEVISISAGVKAARARLLAALGQGALGTHYFGHGAHEMWADEALLTTADAPALAHKGTGTVLFTWACETQYYPYHLGATVNEAMLLVPGGGAVAAVGPTGITRPNLQNPVIDRLYRYFFRDGLSLGEALQRAKAEALRADPEVAPVVEGWSLLGDPSLRLPR